MCIRDSNQQIDQSRLLINQANYVAALERLNQVLAGDPRNEMALRLRALAYMRLSRLAEARNDLNDLLRLKPDDALLLALRGVTAAGLKQFDPGMADVNRAILLDPNLSLIHI